MQNDHCSLVKKEGEEELKSEVFTFKLDFAKDVKKNEMDFTGGHGKFPKFGQ